MKRLLCLGLAVCLMLCACGSKPAGTTAPRETTAPAETTSPAETAAPAETTLPEETTLPAETTVPVEDGSNCSYITVRIEDPLTQIYAGPEFKSGSVALVEEAGAYTIVEEAVDADGNVWGRLKSGAGCVCLTDPPLAPIYADYAEETFNAYHAYWSDETDFITSIGFTPAETLTDVQFGVLDWFEREQYTMDELDPDRCFLAQGVFWGDMTTYGISFTDADGEVRHYAISISGMDGSLLCTEYEGE